MVSTNWQILVQTNELRIEVATFQRLAEPFPLDQFTSSSVAGWSDWAWLIKTRPIDYFDEVRITGLISEPIVLHNRYAQSASPGHHNQAAWYIFEPQLDPDVPPRQLRELADRKIKMLYIFKTPWMPPLRVTTVTIVDFEDAVRSF